MVPTFKSRAILLFSGPGDTPELERTKQTAHSTLAPFSLSIDDVQSINMAGRLIIAFLISCDAAHLAAIEKDLRESFTDSHIDVAAELL